MNQKLQPGIHPDADQLSLFAEGASSATERERMLAHLAECEECRDAVFLMRGPEDSLDVQEEAPRVWLWRRWLLPAGLAAAAVACGLMVMFFHLSSHKGVDGSGQIAAVHGPELPRNDQAGAPVHKPTPAEQSEAVKGGPRQENATSHTVPQERASAAGSSAPRTGGAAPPDLSEEKSESGPTPAPPKAPVADSATVAAMPLNGRNLADMQSLPPGAKAATRQARAEAQQSVPTLRVESPGGQGGTLSGVSGRVTDASGAVIPKATVALRDASGSTRNTATGTDGGFQLSDIPAGRYKLTVTAPGFKSNQQSIDLKPSELAMLQPVLDIGAVSETVTVESSAPLLQTESASVSSMVTELPSRLPVASSASLGKRILSLDRAGSLFFSHNAGKSWKKVNPQWAGNAVSIDIENAEPNEVTRTNKTSSLNNSRSIFRLTTDAGAQWISTDGTRWRPR